MKASLFVGRQADFAEDAAHATSVASRFDAAYRLIWPGCVIRRIPDGPSPEQYAGVDLVVTKMGGQSVTIDEKARRPARNGTVYHDCLLELWSKWHGDDADPKNQPGWSIDAGKVSDLVAYGVEGSGMLWLLPGPELRLACRAHIGAWGRAYGRIVVHTQGGHTAGGWTTVNVPVGFGELCRAMGIVRQMAHRW